MVARDLLDTLQRRELAAAAGRLSVETGLPNQPSASGEHVAGICRQRVQLAYGRFAMTGNGLGFALMPWQPTLEPPPERQVSRVVLLGSGMDCSFGPKRGLNRLLK